MENEQRLKFQGIHDHKKKNYYAVKKFFRNSSGFTDTMRP